MSGTTQQVAHTPEIIEKLQKLLAHQKSAESIGNLAEAEAFAGKVQELLTKYKLDMSAIEFERREEAEPIDDEACSAHDIGIKRENHRIEWQEDLARAVAHCNGCQLLVTLHGNTVFFVGRTSDRQICIKLYAHFVRMAFDLAQKHAENFKDEQREKCKDFHGVYYNGAHLVHWMRAYRHSFCAGFSTAIQSRLYERKREIEKEHERAKGENSTAMVHIRKDAEAIREFIDGMKLKKSKAEPDIVANHERFNRDGYHAGKKAGLSAALTGNELVGAQ